MSNKRILLVNLAAYSKIGGIETYNKAFIKALKDLNYKFDVISVYDKMNEIYLESGKYYGFEGNKLNTVLFCLKNIKKYNIIIATHINLLPLLIVAKLMKPKLKMYISVHGVEVWKKLNFLYRFFISKFIILPVSNYTLKTMKRTNKFKNTKFEILFPCVFNNNERKKYKNPFSQQQFNVLSVSRLDRDDNYKGIDITIKAIKKLKNRISNIEYTIIGMGDDKRRLEKLAEKLDLKRYIDFKGYVKDIEPYYNYCDVFVLPSKGEGFGIVYIEAMKYKKVCIACDIGGQTDIIIDNYNGFLCPYGDVDCLAEKIIALYDDPDIRKQMGENGYNYLIENFTFDKFKKRLETILNLEDEK